LALAGGEVELMHHGDRYPNYNAYGTASYYKTASVLVALRGVLGPELFHRAFTEYGRRWMYKHPTPWDFFDTIEDVSGRDLSWFWRTWFFETWKLDQAIDTVTPAGDSLEVTISNRDKAMMPVHLAVTRTDGKTESLDVPVSVWFDGRKTNATGPTRDFLTPDLEPGSDYHYTITAALRQQDGRVVTQERQVNVRAGSDVVVDFTRSTGATGNVPAGTAPGGTLAPARQNVPPGVDNTPRGVNNPGTRNNVPDDGRVPGTAPPRSNTPGSRNVPGGNNNPGGNVEGVRGTGNPSNPPQQ
jgi:uncharacterized protein (TIGR03000 family)